MKISIADIRGNESLKIYFNWTANALMPTIPGAADRYMNIHRQTIIKMAQHFLTELNYFPQTIYRGIILRDPVKEIAPIRGMKYLSFSTDINIARHFADVDGFGSDIVNVAEQLGTYGYVIEHNPQPAEILFHHALLDILPYAEAFTLIGMNGNKEVSGLKTQKEVMIEQPITPFRNFKPFNNENRNSSSNQRKDSADRKEAARKVLSM